MLFFSPIDYCFANCLCLQGAYIGELLGLALNGWVSERIGYRYTVIGSLTLLIAWTAIFFTAQNVQTLLAAEILAGIVSTSTLTVTLLWTSTKVSRSHGVCSRHSPSPTRPRFARLP